MLKLRDSGTAQKLNSMRKETYDVPVKPCHHEDDKLVNSTTLGPAPHHSLLYPHHTSHRLDAQEIFSE